MTMIPDISKKSEKNTITHNILSTSSSLSFTRIMEIVGRTMSHYSSTITYDDDDDDDSNNADDDSVDIDIDI
eukprot:CAMPEP_0171046132 /NCGR_PEP_ID=MMETSP0736-20130129/49298_1 /TAXON_ID=186038 /ORGANISM="Fragilariopsis kerguelensis, Strain L26-C5" /LENGTH=71 /DNA_ID=CAMNT_0011497005 /DNA_START=689 /DNA_END=901 /DNA_ORIENTATION=+